MTRTTDHQKPTVSTHVQNRASQRSVLRHLPLVAILIAALAGAWALRDVLGFEALRENREALLAFQDANFALTVLLFMAAYVTIAALCLPGAVAASMTGGFLFGLAAGTLINVTSATIGASMVFLAARFGLGETLSARFDASPGTIKRLRDGLRKNELSVLFLLRLVPAVPFFVANLLPAMIGVRFGRFVFATFFGIIPGALVFTWIGAGLGEVFDRGESPGLSLLWEPHIIGPILGLCGLAILPMVVKALRSRKEPAE